MKLRLNNIVEDANVDERMPGFVKGEILGFATIVKRQ